MASVELLTFDEGAKIRDLRRMKAFATGLLIFVTIVYFVCRWQESLDAPRWVSFVRAAAEAGMIGALADWFAVTALFRYPMGIPIPHTAIIVRKKDQLGTALSSFVGTNFLSPEVVTDKVRSARIPIRLAEWMAKPSSAERVAAESATVLRGALEVLNDEDVQQVIDSTIVKRIADPQWGPPIGRVLTELLNEGRHRPLIDMLAERAHQWALGSLDTIDRIVTRDSPSWAPQFVNQLLGERIHRELVDFTWKVRSNPNHELRLAADAFLVEFANDLQNDPETIAKAEKIKAEIMGREEITGLAAATWTVAKRLISESVDDPNSTLRRKIADNIQRIGEKVRDEPEVRDKLDRWLLAAARFAATNYADEITSIISDTIGRWDAAEASRKIEVQVGRDLQFIRINGTVVGALAGLAIYTLSFLMFG